jgi:hypothetical protein
VLLSEEPQLARLPCHRTTFSGHSHVCTGLRVQQSRLVLEQIFCRHRVICPCGWPVATHVRPRAVGDVLLISDRWRHKRGWRTWHYIGRTSRSYPAYHLRTLEYAATFIRLLMSLRGASWDAFGQADEHGAQYLAMT